MRRFCSLLHRWVGLTMALFLVVAGLTGAVISWDHELDEWLNDHLFEGRDRSRSDHGFVRALLRLRLPEPA